MFKLIADLKLADRTVQTEQFFTEGEKDLAVYIAGLREEEGKFGDVRLLETTVSRGKLVTINPDGTNRTNLKPLVRFGWVKFGKPGKKGSKKAKKVAATVGEFDLPPAPKVSKRQRKYGPDAARRTLEGVEAATA
jgi:hypothetical protein